VAVKRPSLLGKQTDNFNSFPIQEYGMNHLSQPLHRHEILKMRNSPQILRRLLSSYELMLDFYGLRLIDEDTGLIGRSLPPKDSPKRFQHLNCKFLILIYIPSDAGI
jgi:hypothetical protein